MIKKKTLPLFLMCFLFSIHFAGASTVSVRILITKVINTFIFSPLSGSYKIYGDGKLLSDSVYPSWIFQMSMSGDSILLKTFEKTIRKYTTINIFAREENSAFKIKSVQSESKVRMYDDNLDISIGPDRKQFLLINKVDLEKYIAGVVESESGTKSSMEYYKLQSILCRTYLLANINRHVAEGFQVCDDVHCQAYLSKNKEPDITKAVLDTKGLVVVDNDLTLITAAFHSNCSAQTVNSKDVWSISTSY